MPKTLEHFKGDFVAVFSNVDIDAGVDEDGNHLSAKQVYIGWLIDYDDTWVVLGDFSGETPLPSALVKIDNIVHIELKLDDPEELLNKDEAGTLN